MGTAGNRMCVGVCEREGVLCVGTEFRNTLNLLSTASPFSVLSPVQASSAPHNLILPFV